MTKINELYNYIVEHKTEKFSLEQIKTMLNLSSDDYARNFVGWIRQGKINKFGLTKRVALNVQSVQVGKTYRDRAYALISKETCSKDESKSVLKRTSKIIGTLAKYSWKPSAISYAKQVPVIEAKRLILSQQSKMIDAISLS